MNGYFEYSSRGRDFIKAGSKIYILPEGEIWSKNPDEFDDAVRTVPKPGQKIWFDDANADLALTAAGTLKILCCFRSVKEKSQWKNQLEKFAKENWDEADC